MLRSAALAAIEAASAGLLLVVWHAKVAVLLLHAEDLVRVDLRLRLHVHRVSHFL